MGTIASFWTWFGQSTPEEIAFNTTQWVSLSRMPYWLWAMVAAALAFSLWLSWRGTRGAPLQTRASLLVLRTLAVSGVVVLLAEPGLRKLATSKEANRVVIAIDTSSSMAQKDNDSSDRLQQALRYKSILEADLANREAPFIVESLRVDSEVASLSNALEEEFSIGTRVASGRLSDLASLFSPENGLAEKSPLAGVVLLSDGADTQGLSPALTPELRANLANLNAPVHTIWLGSTKPFSDIAFTRVITDDFAFVRNQVKVQLLVRHVGFSEISLPITLREDGKPLWTKPFTLSEGNETVLTLEFEPKSAGKHVYTLAAPVRPEESIAENNRIDFALKVIRDRIRVLQVAGRPSWDERFVRRLLRENPSVDLISFFILRSPTDVAGASNRDLSLIPFPTRELFTEELNTFDVVIFQDFNYRPYQMGMYLENVKEFVEEAGGGFLMIGGSLSFSEGDYDNTPIAEILPVQLLSGHGHLSEDTFRPLLTQAGRSHPITDLEDVVGVAEPFAILPELEGVNLVAGLHPDAQMLLAHPYLNAGDGPQPVVAVREVQKGRTMSVMTDSTWMWSLPHVGNGGQGDAHRRFLANALRWLIRDPELSRVKIGLSETELAPGTSLRAEVRSFDARYAPEGGADVRVVFTPLDASPTSDSSQEVILEGKTDADGQWQTEFSPPTPGAWRVRVRATKDGLSIGSDENAFVVQSVQLETLHAEPRPEILRAIAAAGGGVFAEDGNVDGLRFKDHGVEKVHRQKTEPLWNHWLPMLWVALLASMEWWWRRRRGFA